jgi:hypothetical protein
MIAFKIDGLKIKLYIFTNKTKTNSYFLQKSSNSVVR